MCTTSAARAVGDDEWAYLIAQSCFHGVRRVTAKPRYQQGCTAGSPFLNHQKQAWMMDGSRIHVGRSISPLCSSFGISEMMARARAKLTRLPSCDESSRWPEESFWCYITPNTASARSSRQQNSSPRIIFSTHGRWFLKHMAEMGIACSQDLPVSSA